MNYMFSEREIAMDTFSRALNLASHGVELGVSLLLQDGMGGSEGGRLKEMG